MFVDLPEDLRTAIDSARDALGPYAAVHYAEEVDSTNDLALAMVGAGHPAGTSVLADLQRKGRGRRGRSWHSPPAAGLYLSVIVRPAVIDTRVSLVTLAAGTAMAAAVTRTTGLPVELKWPNDLVIGRPWRKLGGVLTEASVHAGRMEGIVLGMGMNLQPSSYPPDLAGLASSLESELGRPVLRSDILVAVLEELRRMMDLFESGGDGAVAAAWQRFGGRATEGAAIRWAGPTGDRVGRARGVAPDGALLVDVDGVRERIIAGEVHWEDRGRA